MGRLPVGRRTGRARTHIRHMSHVLNRNGMATPTSKPDRRIDAQPLRAAPSWRAPGVMIEKFAGVRDAVQSEFLDLNHTSKSMLLVSLMIPKFARDARGKVWRTSQSGR